MQKLRMCRRKAIVNILRAVVLSIILIEISIIYEAIAFPLKNNVETKYQSRSKRDIDILAECETECLPEEKVGNDYDILLYYEYEVITETPYEYAYPEHNLVNEKSCMYRCKILDLNETNDATTEETQRTSTTEEYTTQTDVALSTTNGIEPIRENLTIVNDTISIGHRFINHSVNLNSVQPTTDTSLPTTTPTIMIPKKLKLTVFEVELEPLNFATSTSTKLETSQTKVLNNKHYSTQAPLMEKNGSLEISYKSKTYKDLKTDSTPIDIKELSNFSKENKTLNDTVVKIENTGIDLDSGKLSVNNSEVKCKIYLNHEIFQNNTTNTNTRDFNNRNSVIKPNSSHIDTAPIETEHSLAFKRTTNKPVVTVPTTSNVIENVKAKYQNYSTTENSTQVISDPKERQVAAKYLQDKNVGIMEDTTSIHGHPGKNSDFLNKYDTSSEKSDKIHLNDDINIINKKKDSVTESELNSMPNTSGDVNVTNDLQSSLDDSTENSLELIMVITTESTPTLNGTHKPIKSIVNIDIGQPGNNSEFLNKYETSSDKSDNIRSNEDINQKKDSVIDEDVKSKLNTSGGITNVTNDLQSSYDNSTENRSESLMMITKDSISTLNETDKPIKNYVNVEVGNSLKGNLPMTNKSDFTKELENSTTESLIKVDNTTAIVVNPTMSKPKTVTKLGKVNTEN